MAGALEVALLLLSPVFALALGELDCLRAVMASDARPIPEPMSFTSLPMMDRCY